MAASVILVPGAWLGAWAWDRVVGRLRDEGFDAYPMTLPGLDPDATDRGSITLEDHVRAVVDLVDTLDGEVVLVGHSAGGTVLSEVVDQRPARVRRAVYVDSGPQQDGAVPNPAIAPDQAEEALPPWEVLGEQSLQGLSDEDLADFARRAVPHPAAARRGPVHLRDPARFSVPVTAICTSLSSEQLKPMAHGGPPFFTELSEFDVTYVDLPTGHWPMWSRPDDLADAIVEAARA
ncbi:alpha/beta fold hydrolase [Cellulomonas sp. URHD0024]|uniref:alpha/beta fold hydrolase n=1 Tax=Cellulomonas sp. URHD0024 TaxID=1302620 RepID=UPI0004826A8C|nr:alpha/beta hydrolase [Cellulomonas sp. URHD0024]